MALISQHKGFSIVRFVLGLCFIEEVAECLPEDPGNLPVQYLNVSLKLVPLEFLVE